MTENGTSNNKVVLWLHSVLWKFRLFYNQETLRVHSGEWENVISVKVKTKQLYTSTQIFRVDISIYFNNNIISFVLIDRNCTVNLVILIVIPVS